MCAWLFSVGLPHTQSRVEKTKAAARFKRDDGLHTGVIILVQAFACTSETLAGFQSTFPKTLGRSLVSGFLPADALDASRSDGLKKPQAMARSNPAVCHKTYLERIGRFLKLIEDPAPLDGLGGAQLRTPPGAGWVERLEIVP